MLLLSAKLINWELMVPLAAFGSAAAGIWWLMEFFAQGKSSRTDTRLDEFKNPGMRRGKDVERKPIKRTEAVAKMLEKATPALAAPLQPKNEAEVGKLRSRLAAAGFRGEAAANAFLGLKFGALILGFFAAGGFTAISYGMTQKAGLITIFAAGVSFYVPEIVLWLLVKSRKDSIFLGLPDVLDLLVVCVESGLGLDQAMRKVAEEMKDSQRVLCEELALCNFQIQMGRTRSDVLHDLGDRTQVDDLRALAAILIQAEKFGSSIAQALRVQSDSMRTRRRQLAEERAAKTAVKLIFPLVIFIFPGIFVILVGPAAITMVRQMFPMMG